MIKQGFIYIIQTVGTPYYKIGYSTHPIKRRNSLKTGNPFPIRLLNSYPGTKKEERSLHKYLQKFHRHGAGKEQFTLTKERLQHIVNILEDPEKKHPPYNCKI